jgi:hypothetical protein
MEALSTFFATETHFLSIELVFAFFAWAFMEKVQDMSLSRSVGALPPERAASSPRFEIGHRLCSRVADVECFLQA